MQVKSGNGCLPETNASFWVSWPSLGNTWRDSRDGRKLSRRNQTGL